MKRRNIPKLCGGDIELANFLTGVESPAGTGSRAALALLRKIEGIPGKSRMSAVAYDRACANGYGATERQFDPQDWMRTFLPSNGGCAYIDMDHLEICLPEVLSARDHVAAWNAMLRIAGRAQEAVNGELPEGERIHVLANNSDGQGHSYGSHLDFLITRPAWDKIFNRRLHHLVFLATYQVSSIVFTGQGKVGSENAAPACAYQLSQRADFIEVVMGLQTTFNRPIVNSRDEPLCGGWRSAIDGPACTMARLHVIFNDSTLCDAANFLKVGVMQIILTMIEAEAINPQLILEDPVEALGAWSRDPSLMTRRPLVSGKDLTAVELQLLFLEGARAFADGGGCEGIVPEAEMIIELWADTLAKLEAGDLAALAPRLDWVLKLSMLERAMQQRPGLTWASPEIKRLDHCYSALDGGLYQACERQGAVERLVSDAQIAHFVDDPPEDTRAWARSRLLRIAGPERIESVDWDEINFRLVGEWPSRQTIRLANPLGFTRAKTRFLETATLEDALDILGAEPTPVPVLAPPPPIVPAPFHQRKPYTPDTP